MDIRALLAAPESKTLEFKENLSSLVPIMKTIIAFANTAGGILIIGRSSQGQLVGVNDVFKAEEALANAISDCIHPTILPEIEIITVEGKNLLVVQVSHWKAPFYLKKDGIPRGIYIRLGSTNRPATPELMAELNRSPLTQSFDQEPVVELEKKDLDLEKIDVTFSKVGKKISEENLRSLDILVPYANRLVPSIGGILLFGRPQCRQHLVPNATVSCARFSGTSKSQMLDRFDVKGTLLDAIEEVPKFIARNTHQSSVIKGFLREEIPEYPTIAVREALVNAIAHADYSLPGSCIQVAIFDDRLEIQNPGMFPFGLTIDDFKSGISRIRNRVIARVFHKVQLMEEWGNGYSRITQACQQNGCPEPLWEEYGTTIRVTLFPRRETPIIVELASEESLIERHNALLKLLKEKPLSFHEIYAHFPGTSERTIRYDLSYLKEMKYVQSKGIGRATVWQLTKNQPEQ